VTQMTARKHWREWMSQDCGRFAEPAASGTPK
jgi:hypothetical protein